MAIRNSTNRAENFRSAPPAAQGMEAFTRKRAVVIGAALTAMLLATVGAWVGISALSNESAGMKTMPMLPIRTVIFIGGKGELTRVDATELKRIAGAIQSMGGNMLRTDLNQVKAAVKEVAWVRDAEVRRRFPATLEVRIEEHAAFARWQHAGEAERGLLVNTSGEVFGAETDEALPVLSGPLDSSREVMIQYLAFKNQLAPIGQSPSELRLSPRRAWQLKFDNGSTLELGRSDAEARLARYVRAFPDIAALRAANARIDMRYPSGLAVRVASAATESGVARRMAIKAPTKS